MRINELLESKGREYDNILRGLLQLVNKRGKVEVNGYPHLLYLIGVNRQFDSGIATEKWQPLYNRLGDLKGYLNNESWTRSNGGGRPELHFRKEDIKQLADELYRWSTEPDSEIPTYVTRVRR